MLNLEDNNMALSHITKPGKISSFDVQVQIERHEWDTEFYICSTRALRLVKGSEQTRILYRLRYL